MRRSLPAIALLVLTLAVPTLVLAEHHEAKISDLAWMTGHWEGPAGPGTTLEENWAEPKGKSIASLVRMTTAEATSMVELIVIEEEEGTLMLRLQQWNPGFSPRTPGPQTMKLVESSKNKVVFEAVSEGGMARLGYSRPEDGKFVISIKTSEGAEFDIPLAAK